MKYGMNFQDMISALNHYWTKQGCVLVQPYDVEKGAGTYNPETFFGSLTQKPVNRAYNKNMITVPPSRRRPLRRKP